MVTLPAGARSLFVAATLSTDLTVTLAAVDRYGQEGTTTEIDSAGD
jgi:hypothetical protein